MIANINIYVHFCLSYLLNITVFKQNNYEHQQSYSRIFHSHIQQAELVTAICSLYLCNKNDIQNYFRFKTNSLQKEDKNALFSLRLTGL
jgi:signal transduction protein with GAF and PtsI domain